MCGGSNGQEQAFMASLMADLDGTIFDEDPTPPQPTIKLTPRLATTTNRSQGIRRTPQSFANTEKENVTLLSPRDSRKRSGSWVKKTPSPRKKGILTETQARVYDDEVRAATRFFSDEGASWLSMGSDATLSPSPKVKRRIEPLDKRQSLRTPSKTPQRVRPPCSARATCSKAATCQGPPPTAPARTGVTQYVRCLVEEVQQSFYIPRQYSEQPQQRFTTNGVKPETVQKVMQRKQVVLTMSKLDVITTEKGKERAYDRHDQQRIAILRDGWIDTRVQSGDIVHLIGTWNVPIKTQTGPRHIKIGLDSEAQFGSKELSPPTIVLSSESKPTLADMHSESENIVIVHPDLLLSATAVSSVTGCTRKPFLQAKIKASGPSEDEKPSESLVMGRMLHEVLQSCLTGVPVVVEGDSNESFGRTCAVDEEESPFPIIWQGSDPSNFARSYVKEQVARQVRRSTEDLLQIRLDSGSAQEKLWDAVQPFGRFATTYLAARDDKNGTSAGELLDASASASPLARIVKIHDVEEDIWSPMYGLKGFVDVTVEVEITHRNGPQPVMTQHLVPLELKTGRSIDISQHRAQTMLYTLMMSDRYKRPINDGLLYYSQSAQLHLVHRGKKEINALLMARNDLASYLFKRKGDEDEVSTPAPPAIPPTIDSERMCGRCYVKDACMLYRKAIERISDEVDVDDATPIAPLYSSKTDHLTQKHLSFFQHWESLLSMEETDVVRLRREMWTMTAEAREKTGRCYAGMALVHEKGPSATPTSTGMLHCHVYELKRHDEQHGPLLGGTFAVGDPICISLEPDMLSVAQGHLLDMSSDAIRIGVDKSLDALITRLRVVKPTFRIDKEELVGGMARVRYNLAKLFFAPPFGTDKLRELIVDLRRPAFDAARKPTVNGAELNEDQIIAIEKTLAAEDYSLIVGMPGTGKTTTVAYLIARLAQMGKSILLASYTHSAVDTICRKLLKFQHVKLLRLGSSDRIHEDVQGCMLKPSTSVEDLAQKIREPNVVATTCLSIGHSLFSLRQLFDYCIVDEASQITLPVCLGPIRYASRFVLVGDPQQLPPLVRDKGAREGGLDVSLFELLQRAHPGAVAYLCQQYRMTDDIMALSNALVYDDRLRCGNTSVQAAELQVADCAKMLGALHVVSDTGAGTCQDAEQSCYLERVLQPSTKVLFVDTDDIGAYEERVGDLVQNSNEADIVLQLCATLLRAGVPAQEIAVLTPYRQQIRLTLSLLHAAKQADTTGMLADLPDIEVLTADKAQGRDKDVVILSFVRSKRSSGGGIRHSSLPPSSSDAEDEEELGIRERQHVGQLLQDVRRINVMLTRARKKLIVVGSSSTLAHAPQLRKLYDLMSARDWTWTLSEDDLERHWTPPTRRKETGRSVDPQTIKEEVYSHL